MKFVKKQDSEKVVNSKTSWLLEYSRELNDKDLDFCINTINGRYPEKGYASNLECKEICYILEGCGLICKRDKSITFEEGDVILIDKKDEYFWDGNCKMVMVCSPAWHKEQCKLLD